MQIETARMYIRDFTPNDIDDLHEIFGDSETMKNCEPAYSLEKTRQFLNDFCVGKNGALAAVLKQTNKVIGYILFKPWEDDVYEIGWIFNKKYWSRGKMMSMKLAGYLIKNIGVRVMRMSPAPQ